MLQYGCIDLHSLFVFILISIEIHCLSFAMKTHFVSVLLDPVFSAVCQRMNRRIYLYLLFNPVIKRIREF